MNHSRLIGFGVYSLVFRPPLNDTSSELVGLVTSLDHYTLKLKNTTQIIKDLRNVSESIRRMTVIPVKLESGSELELISVEQVRGLIEEYHTVRKRVEYEQSWKDQQLVQLIYPYAGEPLESYFMNSEAAPVWDSFFQGMCEVGRFLISLHRAGYVHGDLSPNNLLYDSVNTKRFTIVDWNFLMKAEVFVTEPKGNVRVGCWSPEHFCLSTSRLQEQDGAAMYADELLRYTERFIDFTIDPDQKSRIRDYVQRNRGSSEEMYADLKSLQASNPAVIGKYHDLRYFIDTIVKSVFHLFPERKGKLRKFYNQLVALGLAQNMSDRMMYLQEPEKLSNRLLGILESCYRKQDTIDDSISETERSLIRILDA